MCFDPLLQFICSHLALLVFPSLQLLLPLLFLSLLGFPLGGLVLSLLVFHVDCHITQLTWDLWHHIIFVVGGVTIWDGISKAVEEINIGILVVGVGERLKAINNACRDGERGKGTSFDEASCVEVEEPVGTLEVYCWSEAYSGFCVWLRWVSWEDCFVCLGVYAEFYFAVFAEIDGGPCHERPRGDRGGHATIYWERVDPKKCVFYHAGDNSVWGLFVE